MTMSRIAYVNGRYVPHAQATTHIEDRGYQFADGIYEAVAFVNGRFIDLSEHLDRLDHSLAEISITKSLTRPVLVHICHEIMRLNRLTNGLIYLQVTRGIAPRFHGFPEPGTKPVVVMTARHTNQRHFMESKRQGVCAMTLPDTRWMRPDIKSISLLPNVLGKQKAIDNNCYDAILYRPDGTVTETNAANVWIVRQDGTLQTHPASPLILDGITRQRLIRIARADGLALEEKAFSLDELKTAKEIILSASSGVVPVIQLDRGAVGSGQTGAICHRLIDLYMDYTGA